MIFLSNCLSLRLISFLFVISSFSLFSQPAEMKFGKVSKGELTMTQCPYDSSAEAVILCDMGLSYYEYNSEKGFELFFEHFQRIKILKSDGYGWAEFSIPLYNDQSDHEEIYTLKGKTYNLVNGKLVETKLENGSIFTETVNNNWKLQKISMPGVKEGSVIEIKYTIKSPFLQRVRDWQFQYSIPVLWSEYEIRIPEYFKFRQSVTGAVSLVINESGTLPKTVTQMNTSYTGYQYAPASHIRTSSVTYLDYVQRLAASNVPAMKEEPFTNAIENYQAKAEYDLFSYKFPDAPEHRFSSSWEEVVTRLLNDENFGAELKRGNLVKHEVEEIKAATSDPLEQAKLALEKTRQTIKWNGRYSKYTEETLNAARSKGLGNAADVNLYLVLLLKELGLNAQPIALSTRANGLLIEHHPELNGMNYVIAWLNIEGKEYLIAATEPYNPFDLIPFRCLNGKGLMVVAPQYRWVDLTASEANSDLYFADVNVENTGRLDASLTVSSSGYNGSEVRERYFKEGEQEFTRWLKEQRKLWQVNRVTVEAADSLEIPVKVVYEMTSDEVAESQGDLIYFNILLNLGQTTNPFKKEKRDYPVDFGAPIKDTYAFTFHIPEGLTVESIPQPIAIKVPDKSASFRFSATLVGDKIVVNSILLINKVVYPPAEYDYLREIFAQVVEKHSEQIVLRKK